MTWRSLFSNPKPLPFLGAKLLRGGTPLPTSKQHVREMPLPGGPPPAEREALQAIHAQLEGLTREQALRVLAAAAEQVRRYW